MSAIISNPSSNPATQWQGHHHHRVESGSSQTDLLDATSTGATGATTATTGTASTPATTSAANGIQSFADALQSILVSAQAGSTAASGPAGVVGHLAERLQQLLGGNADTTTTAPATTASATTSTSDPDSLQSILNKLQQTLQTTLQSYQAADAAQTNTLLTA